MPTSSLQPLPAEVDGCSPEDVGPAHRRSQRVRGSRPRPFVSLVPDPGSTWLRADNRRTSCAPLRPFACRVADRIAAIGTTRRAMLLHYLTRLIAGARRNASPEAARRGIVAIAATPPSEPGIVIAALRRA